MLGYGGLDKNFEFLVIEVTRQVERTHRTLTRPDPRTMRKIAKRDDYVDHLKTTIESKCYAYLRRFGDIDKKTVDSIRSLNVITSNLERMGDFAVNIVRQTTHLTEPGFMERYDYHPFFQQVIQALGMVVDAVRNSDTGKAIQICEAELELDKLYRAKFSRILAEMANGDQTRNLVTSLFIFHYLERMGDCLLNIGEAVILSRMGEKLKIRQYQSLREAVASSRDLEGPVDEINFEGITGTRSGCRVGKVSDASEEDVEQEVIYKEGDRDKIKSEKDKIEIWSRLAPDLPPRVVDYQEYDNNAALLIEYLEGSTLQEILLNPGGDGLLREVLEKFRKTVRSIWTASRRDEPAESTFLAELSDMIDDVFKVHPQFSGVRRQIGGVEIPEFADLLRRNLHLDRELVAPFRVFAHGDFNLDNIIYNPSNGKVHYIDLHRSDYMDYVRDASVFMVSNFRLPVFDQDVRGRLNRSVSDFLAFTRDFAREQVDETFEARLALGLVRSFVTSTRFELNHEFAENMMARAAYLLGHLDEHPPRPWREFSLPGAILTY